MVPYVGKKLAFSLLTKNRKQPGRVNISRFTQVFDCTHQEIGKQVSFYTSIDNNEMLNLHVNTIQPI